MNKLCLVMLVLVLSPLFSLAQVSESDTLFTVLKNKDEMLFKQGFNQCDLDLSASLITDDLEFYHDKGGVDKGKETFLSTMRDGLCQSGKNKINRHLVANSLHVFPMSDGEKLYGAIQMGEHNFAPPGQSVSGPPAKFVHLWLLVDGEWKLSRVLSYDHH